MRESGRARRQLLFRPLPASWVRHLARPCFLGPIVAGDAGRLRIGLGLVPQDTYGLKDLALSSPGGLMDEAFRMGEVMDQVGVLTFVPSGFSCASACAAVLFIDGKYHMVMKGGALGLHTCYHGATGAVAPEYNERAAQNTVEHGVALGALAAPMDYTLPNQIIWYSSWMADCWGLNRWPSDLKALTNIAPCVKATIEGTKMPVPPPGE